MTTTPDSSYRDRRIHAARTISSLLFVATALGRGVDLYADPSCQHMGGGIHFCTIYDEPFCSSYYPPGYCDFLCQAESMTFIPGHASCDDVIYGYDEWDEPIWKAFLSCGCTS